MPIAGIFEEALCDRRVELGDVIQACAGLETGNGRLSGRGDLELSVTEIVDGRKVSLSEKGADGPAKRLVEGISACGPAGASDGQPGIRFASATIPFRSLQSRPHPAALRKQGCRARQ
jgi:hypothetical protein